MLCGAGGLGWARLEYAGLCCGVLCLTGLDWAVLDWDGIFWAGLAEQSMGNIAGSLLT